MDNPLACKVLSIQQLSPTVRQFRISYAWSDQFIPGQFVMLDLPIEAKFTTRSYSIASAPNSEGWIELCIVQKPGGPGTAFLFSQVTEGTLLQVSEPQGKFVLTDTDSPICFIATGTGVAPFRAMIQENLKKNGALDTPITLVFGNRFAHDILYHEEWENLAATDPNFTFIPVLSRDENWEGPRGYVHEHYLPIAEANNTYHFYLCGWTNMVREAKNKLKSLGFSRKQLKFELYD